jgi:hypothetical protein
VMLSCPTISHVGYQFENLVTFNIRNLTNAQIASPVRRQRVSRLSESRGRSSAKGTEAGYGTGSFVLHPDPAFLCRWPLGMPNIQEKQPFHGAFGRPPVSENSRRRFGLTLIN